VSHLGVSLNQDCLKLSIVFANGINDDLASNRAKMPFSCYAIELKAFLNISDCHTSERRNVLTLSTGSDWSAVNSEGLSAGTPLSVYPLGSRFGLRAALLGGTPGLPGVMLSSGVLMCCVE
jgi:hypothetical protein